MSRRRVQQVLACALSSALVLAPASSRAGTLTGGATEWTQIANNISLVLQYAQQITDYALQAQQAKEMGRMTTLFDKNGQSNDIASLWVRLFLRLNGVVFAGGSLAAEWRRTHPGQKEPSAANFNSIEDAYTAIDKGLNKSAEHALKSLDIYVDPKNVNAERDIIDGLKSKMESADGQAQLTQISNDLLLEVIRQLSVIRQVLMVQARMAAEDVSSDAQKRLYDRKKKARDYEYRGTYRAGGLW